MRSISLFTRFNAAANTCLRRRGVLGCARKARASLRPFSAHCTAIFARQGTRLIAHLTQALAQLPELIKGRVIDFGMVTAQDDLILVITENATLEFARYGHRQPQLYGRGELSLRP